MRFLSRQVAERWLGDRHGGVGGEGCEGGQPFGLCLEAASVGCGIAKDYEAALLDVQESVGLAPLVQELHQSTVMRKQLL